MEASYNIERELGDALPTVDDDNDDVADVKVGVTTVGQTSLSVFYSEVKESQSNPPEKVAGSVSATPPRVNSSTAVPSSVVSSSGKNVKDFPLARLERMSRISLL